MERSLLQVGFPYKTDSLLRNIAVIIFPGDQFIARHSAVRKSHIFIAFIYYKNGIVENLIGSICQILEPLIGKKRVGH